MAATSEQAGAYAVDPPPAKGKARVAAKRAVDPDADGLRHRKGCPRGRVEVIPGNPTITRCIDCGEQTTEA